MTTPPPFFIVGSPRSGTTLLRFMLSSHSRLYVPDETGFLPFLPGDGPRPLSPDEVAQVLARIGRLNRFWAGMVTDLDAFYAALPQPPLLPDVVDALYRQRIAGHGAVRWGDKTPLYVRYVPQLLALFPEAQFIHVVRDGRDATLSAREKWGAQTWYMDAYYLLRNWVRNVEAGRAAQAQLGAAQMLTLRYERLVAEPEAALRGVCTFLGEAFEVQMLTPQRLATAVGGGPDAHVEAQEAIHRRSVGRWRREMTPFEQKMADAVAGPTLRAWDYPLAERGPLSGAERLRLAALALKFAATDSARTLLYRLGVLTLNRNRRA